MLRYRVSGLLGAILFTAAVVFFADSCMLLAAAAQTVVVQDPTGAAVPNATVELRNAAGTILSTAKTDQEATVSWLVPRSSYYQVRVSANGFAPREKVLFLTPDAARVTIVVEPQPVYSRITVSATRGNAEEAFASSHLAFVKNLDDVIKRPVPTIGNLLEHEPGVLVQQSSYAQVSPFLRGFTGYHVLNLVDGMRFNNSTFRSGPNQYLAFIEPTQVQRVEALLGPTGAQYGSDSLGGTIHVVTPEHRFATQSGWETHGDVMLGAATADLSGLSAARLLRCNEGIFWLVGASGRRHNDLRGGRGIDSRNVFHRLFGMSVGDVRKLIGSRQQDSGFRQYGVQTKLAGWIRSDQLATFYYQRGVQDQVRGYKDLLGGLGRLQSSFDPQILNWVYGRYEKIGLGFLDSLSGTFSLNSQTDGGARQNLHDSDPITHDFNRVNVYGYSVQATTHWAKRSLASFGGDIYDEHVSSKREVVGPLAGTTSRPRPLYPNGARYQTYGLFGQGSLDLTSALRATAVGRLTVVRFKTELDRRYLIPTSSQRFSDLTFHTSLRWQLTDVFGFHGLVSRGFRAPNLNDLGALGLNDLGYEIPAAEAITAGALLSRDGGETALSSGRRLEPLRPESLLNYELGMRFDAGRLSLRVQFFDSELFEPIVRRTLLFPASNIPSHLAGLPVSGVPQSETQREQGVVGVATAFDPRAVKAFVNDGRARYYGLESLARYILGSRWFIEATYSYILGRELNPNRNVRRLPPQKTAVALHYMPSGRRPWFEISAVAAGTQERLSGGDLDDERIGASRRRQDIADFFGGSRVRHFLDPVNGVFIPTGETLAQIQDRVLPLGTVIHGIRVVSDNTRVPLYTSTAGWASLSIRSGIPLTERWQAIVAIENLLDHNFRVHGSGIDAAGISAYVNLSYRF